MIFKILGLRFSPCERASQKLSEPKKKVKNNFLSHKPPFHRSDQIHKHFSFTFLLCFSFLRHINNNYSLYERFNKIGNKKMYFNVYYLYQ
jgi:hypothetical protein